jgi:hypothetical protein
MQQVVIVLDVTISSNKLCDQIRQVSDNIRIFREYEYKRDEIKRLEQKLKKRKDEMDGFIYKVDKDHLPVLRSIYDYQTGLVICSYRQKIAKCYHDELYRTRDRLIEWGFNPKLELKSRDRMCITAWWGDRNK